MTPKVKRKSGLSESKTSSKENIGSRVITRAMKMRERKID